MRGYLALVLHAHLPYVRHPEHRSFLEEDWFYEGVTETYLPLLQVFEGLVRDGVPFGITMTMSPPLCSMMADPLLQSRCERHLYKLRELAERELRRTRFEGHLNHLARFYKERIDRCIELWHRYDRNLLNGFSSLQDRGVLEVITCGATHGYLPLMQMYPQAVWAQVKVGVDTYSRFFGGPPRGIWLPECGYYSGVDQMLRDAGLRYFITDGHGILFAHPRPRYGNYAPVFCYGSGVAAFGRDLETSVQVWSKEHGYPGDYSYREFYRDVGYDLDHEYVAPYIQPNGKRKNTGIKYHRITSGGPLSDKQLYDPHQARETAASHAGNFMFNRERQIEYLADRMDRPPIIIAPYDAELYGHWWFEGPQWLEYVLRKSAYDQNIFRTITLSQYLAEQTTQQLCTPAQSSWGDKGYHEYWLNDSNAWVYPHLHKSAEEMIALAARAVHPDGLTRRALNQAARELLLAQSSDWAFIMKSGTMVDYAVRRTRSHLRRFRHLRQQVQQGWIDERWLKKIEFVDNIFPDIDYSVYRPLV